MSEEIPIFQAPPSPDFHGFGPDTYFPSRLIIDTKGEDYEEVVVRMSRQGGRGRPRREDPKPQDVNPGNIVRYFRLEGGLQKDQNILND